MSLRVEGHYLALVTLAFGGIVNLGLLHFDRPDRRSRRPAGPTAEHVRLHLSLTGLVVLSFRDRRRRGAVRCLQSAAVALGQAFRGVRLSEIACRCIGMDVRRVKAIAFAMSAGLGALGGALQSLQTTYLDPGQFTVLEASSTCRFW